MATCRPTRSYVPILQIVTPAVSTDRFRGTSQSQPTGTGQLSNEATNYTFLIISNLLTTSSPARACDSSVGVVTKLRVGRPSNRGYFPGSGNTFICVTNVQISPGANESLYLSGAGEFPAWPLLDTAVSDFQLPK